MRNSTKFWWCVTIVIFLTLLYTHTETMISILKFLFLGVIIFYLIGCVVTLFLYIQDLESKETVKYNILYYIICVPITTINKYLDKT